MNSKLLRKIAGVFALLLVVTLFTSCNRGVGCPSAFDALSNFISIIK